MNEFQIDQNGCLIRYTGQDQNVTLPDNITSIGNRAFQWCRKMESLTIPDSVISIGYGAFNDCSKLAKISLPKNISCIADEMFQGCVELTAVTIPEGVTFIGDHAFDRCSHLSHLDIPDKVCTIGSFAFLDCIRLTSLTIPSSVKKIGMSAFCGCKGLTDIRIPDGVTSIAQNTFRECNNLISIVIPESVTSIDAGAFCDCTNLRSITIPNKVTTIGEAAFLRCRSITSIKIPTGVTRINRYAFSECNTLSDIVIPDGVTIIDDNAFERCWKLTCCRIPSSVTSIGSHAFCDTGLTEIVIPNGVDRIRDNTFNGCGKLTTVSLPDSVCSIDDEAFGFCRELTNIIIPDSVTHIGEGAFECCDCFEDPDGFIIINDILYSYTGHSKEVKIPDGVKCISGFAFFDSHTIHGGNLLRKVVDYFCHLAVKPDFYPMMMKDSEFTQTKYAEKIKWLAHDFEDIYDPDYGDMLRVAFMYKFSRGRLAELVSLLSGRDFETREYKEEIVDESYKKLEEGILAFVNSYNFAQFVLAIKGAGFKSGKLLTSQNTLDFAYMLYLKLLDDPAIPNAQIKHHVQKWFVLSTLTGRYVSAPESAMSRDIRSIEEKGFLTFFQETERSTLSDAFWQVTLPQNLETTSVNSPAFNTFLAAQITLNKNSLFAHGTMIADLLNISGDVHHIFPKAYLKKNGVDSKSRYNQVANYTVLDTQVNKAISDGSPAVYFSVVRRQCETQIPEIGNITDLRALEQNIADNALPPEIIDMTIEDYDEFLNKRRQLMAEMIEEYYKQL